MKREPFGLGHCGSFEEKIVKEGFIISKYENGYAIQTPNGQEVILSALFAHHIVENLRNVEKLFNAGEAIEIAREYLNHENKSASV